MDHCDECGFRYQPDEAEATGLAISTGAGALADLIEPQDSESQNPDSRNPDVDTGGPNVRRSPRRLVADRI